MFFRKRDSNPRLETQATPRAVVPQTDVAPPSTPTDSDSWRAGDGDLVLDALAGVVAALGRHPIDLPHRPADDTAARLNAWHRHVTLGTSVDPAHDTESAPLARRDWHGLVRTVGELRRDEQTTIDTLVGELRAALWTCVSAVHEAVRIDDSAEASTGTQLALVRKAVSGSQMSTVKGEVLSALAEIDRVLRERREEQQRQYRSLAASLDTLGRQLEEAKKESSTDPLTGVGNRKHFDLMANRAIQIFSLGRSPVTLLMVDLNNLKLINDSYGHTAGDAAITTIATALKLVFLRQSDVICRYGGDEFTVILNSCDVLVAQTLARRFVEQVRSLPSPSPAMEFALGASVGIAQLQAGEDVTQWVARADHAMYEAKRQASGGIMIADSRVQIPTASQRRSA